MSFAKIIIDFHWNLYFRESDIFQG